MSCSSFPSSSSLPIVPTLHTSTVLACRFSAWYPTFKKVSIRGVVHKFESAQELEAFRRWFGEDGMRLPEGVVGDEAEDGDGDGDDDDDSSSSASSCSTGSSCSEPLPTHSFPTLTALIHSTLSSNAPSGIFPKLNSTAPQDAQWILPLPLPLKCISAEDVYLVLKASGLMVGVVEGGVVGAGREPGEREEEGGGGRGMEEKRAGEEEEEEELGLEVVLKKWYDMDRSREFRCFVREGVLVGISQRDSNHYEHYLDPEMQSKLRSTISTFFDNSVKGRFASGSIKEYVLDIYLTSKLDSAHIVDFSPYHPFLSSSLLFEGYEELHEIYLQAQTQSQSSQSIEPSLSPSSPPSVDLANLSLAPSKNTAPYPSSSTATQPTPSRPSLSSPSPPPPLSSFASSAIISSTSLPILRTIESRSHPAAARNAPAWPAYPQDVHLVGGGRDIEEFKRVWEEEVKEASKEERG